MKKHFDQFSADYKQLKRTVYGIPIIMLICVIGGKMIDFIFISILMVVFFSPFYIFMTVHDYKRLIKKKIEEPNKPLLTKLLVIEVITWIACIIIIFLPIPTISRFELYTK